MKISRRRPNRNRDQLPKPLSEANRKAAQKAKAEAALILAGFVIVKVQISFTQPLTLLIYDERHNWVEQSICGRRELRRLKRQAKSFWWARHDAHGWRLLRQTNNQDW